MKLRVTEIIGKIWPFYDKTFRDSLSPAGIKKKKEKGLLIPGGQAERYGQLDYDTVMSKLCDHGTYVGMWFVDRLQGMHDETHENEYVPFIEGMEKWISENDPKLLDYNAVVDNDVYVGSLDVVLEIAGENWLIDLKTYDAYKYLFGISDDIVGKKGQPKLSSSNRKKVTLQTSMYRNEYRPHRIDKQGVLWVTCHGTWLIELDFDLSEYESWKAGTEIAEDDLEYGKFKLGAP